MSSKKKNLEILILDDNKTIKKELKEYLHKFNYKVQKCFNISDVVNLLEKKSYDILITDLNIPYRQKNGRNKKIKINTSYQFFKGPGEKKHRYWSIEELIKYVSKKGLKVIILSSYKPEDIPEELADYFIQKKENYKEEIKNLIDKLYKENNINTSNNKANKLTKIISEIDKLKLKLSHIDGFNTINSEYINKSLKKRLEKETDEIILNNLLVELQCRDYGVKKAIDPETSKKNLMITYLNLINKPYSKKSDKELKILKKFIEKYNS